MEFLIAVALWCGQPVDSLKVRKCRLDLMERCASTSINTIECVKQVSLMNHPHWPFTKYEGNVNFLELNQNLDEMSRKLNKTGRKGRNEP
jgi:hypothetical protein